MKTTRSFFPTGTLRRQFQELRSGPSGRASERLSLDELLGAVALVASEEQFDAALVWTARRLVMSEPGLDESRRPGAALLTLALLIAAGEGSTRLPLTGPNYCGDVLGRLEGHLRRARHTLAAEANPAAELVEKAAAFIHELRSIPFDEVLTPELLPTLVGRVKGDEIPFRPLIIGARNEFLSSERMLRKERALATALLGLSQRATEFEADALEAALSELEEAPTYYHESKSGWTRQALNDEQRRAVRLSATRPLTLVTGGPGTGKTTIVVAILRLLVRLGVDPGEFAFAAPTGKAAYRMRESIDVQLASFDEAGQAMPEADRALWRAAGKPRTLHRLLGYSPRYDYFRRSAHDRLDAKVIICDESSMIDLDLMHALVDSLASGARLILVGDANQLPSIAGGAVFRDLVHAMPASTAELFHSYRMDEGDPDGKSIYEFALDVLDSGVDPDRRLKKHLDAEVPVSELANHGGVGRFESETKVSDFVEAWFKTHIIRPEEKTPKSFALVDGEFTDESLEALKDVFEHYARARILCVTRVFNTGARGINRSLHKLFLDASNDGKDKAAFAHLEPVIFLQNNYELGLFNGDQGIVARVSGAGRGLQAVFPRPDGTYRRVPLTQIRHQIELAFAMSIHKSQGSEFKHVAVVLPTDPLPMLTRELLYTAVTRASKSVAIVDSAGLFEAGAARPVQRFTGLVEWIETKAADGRSLIDAHLQGDDTMVVSGE